MLKTKYSPYSEPPVKVYIGANKTLYYVPRHLSPSRWKSRGHIDSPNIQAEIGHTLVHFLYTGTYTTGSARTRSASHQLRRALSVYRAASSHDLPKLQQLAEREMEEASEVLDVAAVIESVRDSFTKLGSRTWVRNKIITAFERDCAAIKSDQLLARTDTAMTRFLIEVVMGLFQEKLSHMLTTGRDLRRKLESASERLAVHELQSNSARPEIQECPSVEDHALSMSSGSSSYEWVSPVSKRERWSGTTLADGDGAPFWQSREDWVNVSVPTILVSGPLDQIQEGCMNR